LDSHFGHLEDREVEGKISDFGRLVALHFAENGGGVESIAIASLGSTNSSRSLLGAGLRNQFDLEHFQAVFRVNVFVFFVATVHYVLESVNRNGGFSDVGADDYQSLSVKILENFVLEFCGEFGVKRDYHEGFGDKKAPAVIVCFDFLTLL
jgi:hypothetical protein